MEWTKLADRCRLFTDKPRALLIELLKEGEDELARRCDIFEREYSYTTPLEDETSVEYDVLPEDYKSMISVHFKGSRLNPMGDDEVYLNTDNTVHTGTPTKYHVSNNKIYLNKIPASGDKLLIKYYGLIGSEINKSIRPLTVGLDLNSGETAVDYYHFRADISPNLAGLTATAKTTTAGIVTGSLLSVGRGLDANASYISKGPGWEYRFVPDVTTISGLADVIHITNYREVAPLIPAQYHKNLCDYAIALSNAKNDLHDKHIMMWENSILQIQDEDARRDLVYSVKEVI
tara:strand:+ start:724 stop:1590 length:867 start_codon:yes stop_codon:yes gene_type:complete